MAIIGIILNLHIKKMYNRNMHGGIILEDKVGYNRDLILMLISRIKNHKDKVGI